MFAGIVRGTGRILAVEDRGGDRSLTVGFENVALDGLLPGASIAVSGVCLTATACHPDRFSADVSIETLGVTTLGSAKRGDKVNIEPALRLGERLDGHLVTGHVDGIGEVSSLSESARSLRLQIGIPVRLSRYVARKGSIAVDGVSLTVNAVSNARFEVNIVPHTRIATVISEYKQGTPVNIEVDIIARYLERLVAGDPAGISLDMLKRHGFASND